MNGLCTVQASVHIYLTAVIFPAAAAIWIGRYPSRLCTVQADLSRSKEIVASSPLNNFNIKRTVSIMIKPSL